MDQRACQFRFRHGTRTPGAAGAAIPALGGELAETDPPARAVKPIARPVYLDLFRIRLPLAGWVSILHRMSGALLFVAFPLGVWALSVSLSGEAGFRRVTEWLAHPPARLVLLLLVWAFAHHFFAGLRHLALDVHWGMDLRRARQASLAVLLASALVTLLAAWKLFA